MIPKFREYLNESVWGDIRKKSLGTEIRYENIVDFNSLDGGTMEDLYNYIIQNYEYTKEPANEYRSIRQLRGKNISIPITLDGGMMETTIDYSNPDEMEFIVIRNDLVKYLDDEAYAKYYDYVEKDNPDDEVTKIIVDGDYFPKKNMIGIIDALLENVPDPALRKKEIKESVWGDIRKKSLGQEERIETSIDEYSIDNFFKYLKDTYDTVSESDLKTGILNSGSKYINTTIFVQGQNYISLFYNDGRKDEIYFNIMKPEKFEPLVTSRIKAFISIIKDVFVVRDTNPSDKQQEGYGIKASKEYPKGRNTLYRKVLNMAIIAFSPKTKKDSYMAIKPKDPNILNESVWGDIRKKSIGQEERSEDSIDNLGIDEFIKYLNDRYKGEKFVKAGQTVMVTFGYMMDKDVNPDYWNIGKTKEFWSRDNSKKYYMSLFYHYDEPDGKQVTMTVIGKKMITMQKSTASIFDELDKRFNITEDDHCVWFKPLNGKETKPSFYVKVIDGLIEVMRPPFIQTIFKK